MLPIFAGAPHEWAETILSSHWHRYILRAIRRYFDAEVWLLSKTDTNFSLNGVTFRFFHGVKYVPASYIGMISSLKAYKGKAVLLHAYFRQPTDWLIIGMSSLPIFLLDFGFLYGTPGYYTSFEKVAFKRVYRFYVSSVRGIAYLEAMGIPKERIQFTPVIGTDPNIFRPLDKKRARDALGIPPQAKIVLYPGWFGAGAPFKGLPQIIEAVETLRSKGENIELVCVGYRSTEEVAEYRKSFVHFFKRVPLDMMPLFYNSADVTALYLDENFVNKGGGGINTCVVESLFCGTPVVSNTLRFYPYKHEIPIIGRYVENAGQLPKAIEEACSMANRTEIAEIIRRHEEFTLEFISKTLSRDCLRLLSESVK
jgi:glycosyltransferase involved in cell wall biosynthesis